MRVSGGSSLSLRRKMNSRVNGGGDAEHWVGSAVCCISDGGSEGEREWQRDSYWSVVLV